MAFNGIYPAAPLMHTIFGIFSAARVTTDTSRAYDERWVRGFNFEFDSRPTLRLLEDAGSAVHTMFNGAGLSQFIYVKPFFIEVEDARSTFGLTGEDRFARVLRQIEAATQKAVERELENGYVRRTDGTTTQYLTDASSLSYASSTPGTAVSSVRGISLLEHSLSSCPIGEQGVLHITRDVAVTIGTTYLNRAEATDDCPCHLQTPNGTPVSVGSGYSGNGPAVTVTNKALTSNEVTLTTSAAHYISVGESILVSDLGSPFDGTYTAKAGTTGTTVKYDKTATNVASTADAGYVQMQGSSTVKWLYATGCVDVLVGKADVVNDTVGHGYDVSGNQNDMKIKAIRPVAVYFDPAMHYAVKVDLTA